MQSQKIITTEHKTQVIDVTRECQSMIGANRSGIAVFSILHTTAALIVCEDDADLRADIVKAAENWLESMRPFQHARRSNPNAEAHIISAFAGTSVTIPIADGKLLLGTWQNILLLELDGPKQRKLICTIIVSSVD